jgi:GTP cyclohydrolase II
VSLTGDVINGLLGDLNCARGRAHTNGRPFVTLSYAQSVDGCIALESGSPFKLSGPEALQLTHALRAAHDGILVGIGTVLADDPQLTVRLTAGANPQPVVVDSHLRTPASARLFDSVQRDGRPAWIATTNGADPVARQLLEARGARVLRVPAWANGWVDLPALLATLSEQGVEHLMVEGGAKIITSFLRSRLVDYAVITVAPHLLGGLSALADLSSEHHGGGGKLNGVRPRLGRWASHRLGEDLVLSGEVRWTSE